MQDRALNLRIVSADEVRRALPMREAIEAMRRAFGQLSAGEATMPTRSSLATPNGTTLLMPAYLHRSGELAVKVVSMYSGNSERGLPVVTATVLVLDPETGFPQAVIDGTSLTTLRTGAAGGLAASLLARPDTHTVALFGAGVQARVQLEAVLAVRPVERVWIVSRTTASAEKLAQEIRAWTNGPEAHVATSPREAVRQADLVIAATTSTRAVFDGRDLKPGTHITGVGSFTPEMQEVDAETIARARVIVDSRAACAVEAGELIQAGSKPETWTELGEIVNGTAPGRESVGEITFFKSVGVAVQDAVAAQAVLERLKA